MSIRILPTVLVLLALAAAGSAASLEGATGDPLPFASTARQAALGGCGVAISNGPAATYANPAAMPSGKLFQFGAGSTIGADEYFGDGSFGCLSAAWEPRSWRIGAVALAEDFSGPAFYGADDDGPRHEALDIAVGRDLATVLGADPERWAIRLGGSVRWTGREDADGNDQDETDGVVGILVRRLVKRDGQTRLAWRGAATLGNVIDAVSSGDPARRSDLTMGAALTMVWPQPSADEPFDADSRWVTTGASCELATVLDGGSGTAYRLGVEVGYRGWLDLRCGWCDDPLRLADGFSWGIGLEHRWDGLDYVRFDLSCVRFRDDHGLDESTVTVGVSTSYPTSLYWP